MKYTLLTVAPILLGVFIYANFRSTPILLFDWIPMTKIALDFNLDSKVILPQVLIFNLPDCLWLFALNNCMLLLWKGYIGIAKNAIILVLPLAAYITEFLQLTNSIFGFFDVFDIIFYSIANIPIFFYFIKQHFYL